MKRIATAATPDAPARPGRPDSLLLHEAVQAQARRTPHTLAVLTAAGGRLTYAELDRLSDRLAAFLVRQGIGPETPVGVCLERSPELVVALLAVLKAGAVYLPLDPAYPVDRLSYMLEDSGAPLVLTRTKWMPAIFERASLAVALDAPGGPLETESAELEEAALPIQPENLAYLIYTSGSTGRPKGVGVAHAEAAEHLGIFARFLGLREGERLLQFSSPSFDMAMEEILAPLISGAAVVLRAADLWQPASFLDRVAELGVTVVNLPTAYWHQWTAELERAVLPAGLSLRLVMLGGEAMTGESARRWRRSRLSHLRVINGYGPTEGVITSTVIEVDAGVANAGMVAIGRALEGRSALVLDPRGQRVPDGSEGELCLGGPLMARGYQGQPEATAERFVPDPFSGEPGARLYRTGDRARCRPDGVLEFLGRIDRQVKVRGFRVEPGEVEATLARHPDVREVAVDGREDATGGIRLVAWVVPALPDSVPLPAQLRELLGETLPEYMIPSAFVTLAELPLTPNGKIDYRALPEPPAVQLDEEYIAPATLVEERLAAIWAEALGCKRVGVRDSFFALGGHSLLGMRVLSRIRDLFGVDVPISVLLGEPTVGAMARAVEAAQLDSARSGPRLAAVPRKGHLPLSPAQQGLWFLDRLEPGLPVYNIASAVALSGPLDAAALEAALGALVRRHEPLRTRFPEVDGEPRQEIFPPEPFVMPRIDLSALADPQSELERRGREEARRAFDLARGPLLRACLVALRPGEQVLLVTVHHIVFDGWSETVFWQDLSAFYAAASLPDLPLQYADYSVWQQSRLEGVLAAEVEWWRRRLDGIEPLELPTDRPRPASRTWSGDVRPWILPAPLAGAVRELALRQGATPFMALFAAFSALLSRTSGQYGFAVGVPVAGRGSSELEGLIGMFVNMLALRADLSGRPTLRDLVDQTRETVLAALGHQDLPFDRLVQELNPARDLSRNPIFQVSFQVVDRARSLPAFLGVRASAPGFHSATSKFDLEISLEDHGGEIRGECEYSTDLFDSSTIEHLLARFELLAAAATTSPGLPLAELPLLSEAERRQILEWSGLPSTPAAPEGLIHRLFEEQARRQPGLPAVGDLTYAELDCRATDLARHLRELGVGPEVRVGVCLERSPDLVVSVLAVLKAGGAYVALDPSHPEERLAFQIEDSRASVVVTRRELAGIRVVSPDDEPETLVSIDGPQDAPEPLPGNLAYVIYTSGSTGRPKGVELTHGSLRNLVAWHVRAFGLTPADRSALMAGVGFDASVWEVWPALAAGASLRVMPEEVRTSPEAVRDWLVEQGVTVTFLPTPLTEAVLALEWPQGLAMRALLTGGDRLHRSSLQSVPFALFNNYGPTEGTVVSTSGRVASAVRSERAPSIGRPIDGAAVFVVDRELRPVPPGVPGELLVGGAGLARGYAGRPDLTAGSFVPDPLSGREGERLYRTGDRVRFLPGGELEFLGRIDHQVKVRGYRIELGEIETALARHPLVREAAVLFLDGGLVAYVGAEEPVDFAAFLRRSLPDFMIPSAFVPLPSLPLSSSGKVDRQALARIAPPVRPESGSFSDPAEELVASLWAEVLDREVRPGDNFFHLGGHSLLAARVLSRIREALGVSLPLQALFESPTVSALAREIAVARRGSGAVLPPLRQVARGGLLPLSFPQQRLWFMDRLAPDKHTYNIPLVFALRGHLDTAALIGAVAGVVDRHEVLRTRFVEMDGQPWQEILPPGTFAVPLVDLSGLRRESRERELARIGREEGERPFVLSLGPMLRAGLVRLGAEEHALLLTLHHIASDGWSEEILDRELSALYEGSPLPDLPIQYADFSAWQRSWPEEVLAGQVEWWTRRLAGLANLEVPTDRARPPVQGFRGAMMDVSVPPSRTRAVRDLSRARRSTLFMTLLAAWQALFHRITCQSDVAVGSPVANRNRPEVENLIGFFINMLALRTDCGGDPTFGELLDRVRHTALEAYDHADVPFERLIDELGLKRDLSRQALVQVMFSLHTPPPVPALRGLESKPLHFAGAVAKFDLTLGLFDQGDQLDGWIEYSTDLFDRSTVARLAGHFLNLLESATDPDRRLSELELLSAAERHQILGEWNDTAAPFPADTLMHQFFEAAADRDPQALAAVWDGRELTYAGLEERTNRIANLLRQRCVGRGTPVGVWMERSLDMVAGVLAVLKAGGYYVPLDPAWPEDRVESILEGMEAPVVLTRSAHLGRILEMQWRLSALTAVICLDVETPEPAPEPVDTESVRALFDLLSERSVDRVTAGGFASSFTGALFSEAEVDEYRDRVLSLASPWLSPDKRVLEIGSGSGLLLWEIAPRVARFVGLDPSPLTQERNRARAAELGLLGDVVELPVGFAHEIEGWAEGSFDLVLIASTAQFFPGPLYLERVAKLAERLLAPGGALVIADVPDARRQEELRAAVEEYRLSHGLPVKQDPHKILSVDADFFRDLGASVHHRETGFDNELRFRYDVVLTHSRERSKSLLTSWHADRCPADRPAPVAAPEDLAYVIHTSGSTGQPKGIVVQHRPVANLIAWINPAFSLVPSDRVLFVTSLCFDLSVWDIFGVLAAGGCVHVASEEDLRDAERLMRILREEPVTIWDSAPAALVRLAPLFPSEPAVRSRLRRVMLSGDWIPVTLPDRVRVAFPQAEVTSLGGATEATVWSNWYPIGEVNPEWPSIPYGRPMPNAQYHVLDAGLSHCPAGMPGDLYIGGDCLCMGYAHQPDLTAAAFVPDPYGAPGTRLYRTGDRARTFPDGNLEFLGRVDHQVKIRGFRIELGEIEVALARHAAVREAVVLAREDVSGDKRLVAYVVPAAGEPLPDLKEFVRQSLPDYMIPAAFVELETLPVTPNGKLDRRALPAPRWDHGKTDEGAVPGTSTEQALAALWREILGVEHIGVHDSFFDLGGHSLLATQLVARIRESFHVEVPLCVIFQAPVLGELAAALDAELDSRRSADGPVLRPVPRDREMTELPLSASQLRQWFLVQLEPESVDYNLPIAVRLEGELHRETLTKALRAVIRRHEALRTTFISAGGRPAAVISPDIHLSLPVLDLSSTPEAQREAAVLRAAVAESDQPFDLTRGPLLRALLLRLGAREFLLIVTVHHIVFDGFSTGVFLRDLSALYQAEISGVPADLPALTVQYADYAAWQQEWLRSPALRARLDRWKERLAGASQVLDLPTDRPRPATQSPQGEMVPMTLPADGAAEIRRLARREGATLFMTLLAGYASLLSRYTGQEDLNVGTFVANRPQQALERLIGFFVNTLVLRLDLAGDPTFRELLARVRETALDAFDNQEVPFESLLDELETGRDLSRGPLFQVMFGLQNFAMPTLEVPGLTFRPVSLMEHARTNGDLAFWMWEEGDALSSLLQLSTDLFDASTVMRMFRHMERLLRAVSADPGLRLSELPLLSAGETSQILVEWNRPGEREPEPDGLVHERFEHWAGVQPGAVALETADGREALTYAELNRRGNRVAHRLRRLGVRTDSIVGIWAERSLEFVVGVLGVLKAGGAYMPLDPSLPADRLAAIVRGSGISVLLAPDEWPAILSDAFDGEVVTLRGLTPSSPEDDHNPAPWAVPESLVYVLFTSGSTGLPKGVLIGHSALANFAETTRRLYGIGPNDRVLQFSSLVFDISVEEIFTSWTAGAALVLRDEEMVSSPARFLRACGRLDVQMIDLPTAYWHELGVELAKGEVPLPTCVRSVVFAGERALLDRMAGWQEAMRRGVRLFNSYGPTEATPASSVFDPSEPVVGTSTNGLSIGKPMRGARLYVVDPDLRPVPLGGAGELLIAGASLGRGYAGRPDLTAERFVPDPFAGIPGKRPGERVYRTGDRVRWLRDGNLEFLGRVDDQVKIRGFRIEPGEVAAVICRHPGVREAVVVPREAGAAGLRLVAYAAADPGTSVSELRDLVKSALPAYMVPADFVLLDALPLTATGKLDRRALPDPPAAEDDGYAPPETVTEELLAELWASLLGRERVGIFDNFFDLGGHSLLAPQMFSKAEEIFQVELPLRTLFEAPTVAQLANLIEQELLAQIEELSDEEAENLVFSGLSGGKSD